MLKKYKWLLTTTQGTQTNVKKLQKDYEVYYTLYEFGLPPRASSPDVRTLSDLFSDLSSTSDNVGSSSTPRTTAVKLHFVGHVPEEMLTTMATGEFDTKKVSGASFDGVDMSYTVAVYHAVIPKAEAVVFNLSASLSSNSVATDNARSTIGDAYDAKDGQKYWCGLFGNLVFLNTSNEIKNKYRFTKEQILSVASETGEGKLVLQKKYPYMAGVSKSRYINLSFSNNNKPPGFFTKDYEYLETQGQKTFPTDKVNHHYVAFPSSSQILVHVLSKFSDKTDGYYVSAVYLFVRPNMHDIRPVLRPGLLESRLERDVTYFNLIGGRSQCWTTEECSEYNPRMLSIDDGNMSSLEKFQRRVDEYILRNFYAREMDKRRSIEDGNYLLDITDRTYPMVGGKCTQTLTCVNANSVSGFATNPSGGKLLVCFDSDKNKNAQWCCTTDAYANKMIGAMSHNMCRQMLCGMPNVMPAWNLDYIGARYLLDSTGQDDIGVSMVKKAKKNIKGAISGVKKYRKGEAVEVGKTGIVVSRSTKSLEHQLDKEKVKTAAENAKMDIQRKRLEEKQARLKMKRSAKLQKLDTTIQNRSTPPSVAVPKHSLPDKTEGLTDVKPTDSTEQGVPSASDAAGIQSRYQEFVGSIVRWHQNSHCGGNTQSNVGSKFGTSGQLDCSTNCSFCDAFIGGRTKYDIFVAPEEVSGMDKKELLKFQKYLKAYKASEKAEFDTSAPVYIEKIETHTKALSKKMREIEKIQAGVKKYTEALESAEMKRENLARLLKEAEDDLAARKLKYERNSAVADEVMQRLEVRLREIEEGNEIQIQERERALREQQESVERFKQESEREKKAILEQQRIQMQQIKEMRALFKAKEMELKRLDEELTTKTKRSRG